MCLLPSASKPSRMCSTASLKTLSGSASYITGKMFARDGNGVAGKMAGEQETINDVIIIIGSTLATALC